MNEGVLRGLNSKIAAMPLLELSEMLMQLENVTRC